MGQNRSQEADSYWAIRVHDHKTSCGILKWMVSILQLDIPHLHRIRSTNLT